jgi:hypothetical protein
MIQTRYTGDYTSGSVTTPWTNERFYPIMALGMTPLRWWMPPMKMDLRCPSTPAAPWRALGVLLPRGYDNPIRDNSVLSPKPLHLVIKQ